MLQIINWIPIIYRTIFKTKSILQSVRRARKVQSTHYVIYTWQHDKWDESALSGFTYHLSFVARAGARNKERRIPARCNDASSVCGCHGVATCLARYAPIASPERKPNERTNAQR